MLNVSQLSSPTTGGGAIAKRFYPSNLFTLTQASYTYRYSVNAMTYDIGGQTVAAISGYADVISVDSGREIDVTLPSGIRPSAKQTIIGYTTEDHGVAPDTSGSPEVITIDAGSIKLSDVFRTGSSALAVQFEGVYLVD